MAETPPPRNSRYHRIEHACDRFEAAWKAGEGPRIEQYLDGAADSEERAELFRELLALELEHRRLKGEQPLPADYTTRFPAWAASIDAVFGELDATDSEPAPVKRLPIRLNCPHCKNSIAVVEDEDEDEEEITCPSCGTSFRLDSDRTVSWSPEQPPHCQRRRRQDDPCLGC